MEKRVFVLFAVAAAAFLAAEASGSDLLITPADDFESFGSVGGPFAPASIDYELTNIGPNSLSWAAWGEQNWVVIDPEWSNLDPCMSVTVTVSLTAEANSLVEGIYSDTLSFWNDSDNQIQTREAVLTVMLPGSIVISPNSFDVNVTAGCSLTEMLTIENTRPIEWGYTIRTRHAEILEESGAKLTGSSGVESGGGFSRPPVDLSVPADADYKPDEVLVRFAPGARGRVRGRGEKERILASLGGGTIKRGYKLVPGLNVVKLPAGVGVKEALKRFNKNPNIVYAQPNYRLRALSRFPDDEDFEELWGMHNTGQTGGTDDADIDAPEAWGLSTGSGDIVVAVIDTGVDYTHPDLAANMWVNELELNGAVGVDDDGNGYVDDIYGYDFYNSDGDPMDDHFHGTHVSGTIGAVGDNGEGVAGVCWEVRIMALKFLASDGYGWTEDAIDCIEYSVLMGANLSNNSWGGDGYDPALEDAIEAAGAAGMLFVAAAGNDDGQNNDTTPHYPSSYDSESIIAVISTDEDDNMSSFSNYGPTSVDIAAPGSSILSCDLGGGYRYANGTSMATPHVAGACALLWSMNPEMTNQQVKDLLLETVDKTLPGKCVSEGRLNLYSAVLETSVPWITIDPEVGVIGTGESNDVSVTFDATTLAPGTYEAEIVFMSDDPWSPRIVPVTLTVVADDLAVAAEEGFESSGMRGGPFEPDCTIYTLTNNGVAPVSWAVGETQEWLEVDPCEGVLGVGESVDVNVCISSIANLLEPNVYTDVLAFVNINSGCMRMRSVRLTVRPPDTFTESFGDAGSDMDGFMLTLRPDGSTAYYEACRQKAEVFPTDPNDGTYVLLWDDNFVEVVLTDYEVVSFYGVSYDRFYIGSNGYITFGGGDVEWIQTLEDHFRMPRISALFTDLAPDNGQNVSYKQLEDRVAVTFENVPLYGEKETSNSFQIEMFFVDETIRITWLGLTPVASITGISEGLGLPPVLFSQSDLSYYAPCCPCGDFNRDYLVNFADFGVLANNLPGAGCGIPYWCGGTDIDLNGKVDGNDLGIFMDNWLAKEDWWLEPVARWEFEEGEGDVAYDSAGEYDGTLRGDAKWVAGATGSGALEFDGDGDGVYIEGSSGFDSALNIYNSDLSISAWVKVRGAGGAIVARSKPYYTAYRMGVSGTVPYINTYRSGSGHWSMFSDQMIMPETWYHIVGVFDRAGDMGRVYVNGVLEGEREMTTDPVSTDARTKIGCRNDVNDLPFDGAIDDIRIYDRVLSYEEIRVLYRGGPDGVAFNPYPVDGAMDVDPNVVVTWSGGLGAVSHDVYFGTDFNDVNDANTSSGAYMGNHGPNSFDPGGLEFVTTYYWRIDEVGEANTLKGVVWSLTTWGLFDPNFGLAAWWEFDEGSEITAYDSAGDNDGTLNGDANWVSGWMGSYALDFDGDGDYVEIPDDNSLTPSDEITIALWLYNKGGQNAGLWKYASCPDQPSSPGNSRAYAFRTEDTTDAIRFVVFETVSLNDGIDSVGTVGRDEWHHIAATFDNGEAALYIDGQFDSSATLSVSSIMNDAQPLIIGGAWEYCGDTFTSGLNGMVDDVRIYNIALSDSDIEQLYQLGSN